MALTAGGTYVLRIKFGSNDITPSPAMMEQFVIIQDMKSFLPSIRIRLVDNSGVFTHISPPDRDMSVVSVQFGNSLGGTIDNEMDFNIYRTHPQSAMDVQGVYQADGLLDVGGVFNPDFCRGFVGPVSTFLQDMAFNEMKVDVLDISPNLGITKKILQPRWSNLQVLRYLKANLGDELSYAYMPYIYVKNANYTFAFKSLEEMALGASVANFVASDEPNQDHMPIFNMRWINSQRLLGVRGIKVQTFKYFDYESGGFVSNFDTYENYLSLSDYISVDQAETTDDQCIDDLGRTNEFTQTFGGKVRTRYYTRINDLVKMWIESYGIPNIVPGEVVKIVFPQGLQSGNMGAYQYAGYWLVERVVHSFGYMFITKLLLTRAGVDTDQPTSLLPAARVG